MEINIIANQKGGAGKSTVAVNLAAGIGDGGRSVLLIDADPQASTTRWLQGRENVGGKSFYKSLVDGEPLQDAVTDTDVLGVDLISSGDWLVKADKQLSAEPGAETILRARLEELPARWEHVLIDTPPNLDTLTVNALAGADAVLIPVQARYMALEGLARLMRTVDMVKERLNETLEITGVIPNQVDARTKHSGDVIDALRDRFGDRIYEPGIRENIRLAEAPSHHETIFKYAPKSRGNKDFRRLSEQFIERHSTEVQ
jgi:chromosome partitioning protein